ncbi:hypothetical protein ACFFSW_25990 [Saccharothrix longispora]|uniref:Uncharacterized protein n=1 Tax=Saccharothrix longispora TaxID=33920 RepID=A0ABU1PP92_9PSEU|nr:hypothetical protein [Saccharothrix longispora]MDR6592482.1 hypothetical protein [Saccharothrix longispora]
MRDQRQSSGAGLDRNGKPLNRSGTLSVQCQPFGAGEDRNDRNETLNRRLEDSAGSTGHDTADEAQDLALPTGMAAFRRTC